MATYQIVKYGKGTKKYMQGWPLGISADTVAEQFGVGEGSLDNSYLITDAQKEWAEKLVRGGISLGWYDYVVEACEG